MEERNRNQRQELVTKAGTLVEALPYMRRYSKKGILIKFGGHAMRKPEYINAFAEDVVLLDQIGAQPVVVHGGGPQIGEMLDKLKIESNFVNGQRVTDKGTISVVEMVLSGSINKALVTAVAEAGGRAAGISGKDGGLICAKKFTSAGPLTDDGFEKELDLGFVGEPTNVDTTVLKALMNSRIIPIVAPIGFGENSETYNINADIAAGAVAAALEAKRMLMLTDVSGVLDKTGNLLEKLTIKEAEALIVDGTISGGMIPKVRTCIKAVHDGVEGAVIMDGRKPHSLLVELFTEHGMGTMIVSS